MVKEVSTLEYALGLESLPVARIREDVAIRSHLAGCAGRAALRSLDGDMGSGTTGGQSATQFSGVSLALTAG